MCDVVELGRHAKNAFQSQNRLVELHYNAPPVPGTALCPRPVAYGAKMRRKRTANWQAPDSAGGWTHDQALSSEQAVDYAFGQNVGTGAALQPTLTGARHPRKCARSPRVPYCAA